MDSQRISTRPSLLPTRIDTLEQLRDRARDLRGCVVRGLDLRQAERELVAGNPAECIFLGCDCPPELEAELRARGAAFFPRFRELPYEPYRPRLYAPRDLIEGFDGTLESTCDFRIYDHFVRQGRHRASVVEALAQRMHDHAIDEALRHLLSSAPRRIVAIMGGHGKRRDHDDYAKVARLGWLLGRAGYFVASGGGPGMMEAANLGAYLSAWPEPGVVDEALAVLAKAPAYARADGTFEPAFFARAQEVAARFSPGAPNLAIPTWFYGHEPSNLFATDIAKFFSNSLREDGLLAIAEHGVVFAPGSAGTTQEIFMDATQNHYATFGSVSPMVFFGVERYAKQTQIFDVVKDLARGRPYADLLGLCDSPEEVVAFLQSHPPLPPAASPT